ncbi:hypothetical protein BU26DRAFT_39147 [Trematosphaeria pertusa]|uniref:Uncharacterized protein n=1 Tax=Trematosphaeria pertusa TaxID=390896 RepID=A0A6A6J4S7_9PLEO|nr:uncharacterized protein BU26DRAFT_39147 [Trematosphaeria pertusa]KAF2257232.1 hypothetical protein BU26DRAFT_39147 [Trematosphaeria pertusa]
MQNIYRLWQEVHHHYYAPLVRSGPFASELHHFRSSSSNFSNPLRRHSARFLLSSKKPNARRACKAKDEAQLCLTGYISPQTTKTMPLSGNSCTLASHSPQPWHNPSFPSSDRSAKRISGPHNRFSGLYLNSPKHPPPSMQPASSILPTSPHSQSP